jgi:hypothetical protein
MTAPAPVSVGTLTVEGLGETMALEPRTAIFQYGLPAGVSLGNPPCETGEPIRASASDFELEATCIPQLELSGADPIPVETGEPVHVEWVASSAPGSRIRLSLDVAHHGGKTGEVNCDVADTGSFDIPAVLVDKLVSLGLAGFPTINVNRVSVGSDASGRPVNLIVSSEMDRAVDTGVVSCTSDEECPDGQTCQASLLCG